MNNPNTWHEEALLVHTYENGTKKARVIGTLCGEFRAELKLPNLDKFPEVKEVFKTLKAAQDFCETELRNRNLDGMY